MNRFSWFAVLGTSLVLLSQSSLSAALILHESFDGYQSGRLGGQGGWSGSDPAAVVDFGGGLRWSSGSIVLDGGAASLRLTDHGSYTDYSQFNAMSLLNDDAVYLSFLVRGVGLDDYRDDTSLRVATNAGVGFSYHDGSPVIYAQRASGRYAWTPVENDTTYLIVAKLWKSVGGTDRNYDRWTIFIDPTSMVESLNNVAFSLDGSIGRSFITTPRFWGDFDLDGQGKAVYYDEVKIGTTFSSVIPEPISVVLLGLGAIVLLTRQRFWKAM